MHPDRFRYCLDQLKRFDHDRYLAVLLMREAQRAPLAALYAFDTEMARIPSTVSEPMLAEIRFQWWREALEGMTPAGDPGHEIAAALAETLFDLGIAPADFLPLIDLRARDMAEDPFQTLEDFTNHQRAIAELHLNLILQITREELDAETTELVLNSLSSLGMINQVRRLPHDIGASQLCLPLDLMAAHDIDPHDLFQGLPKPGFRHAINDVLQHAVRLTPEGGQLDLTLHKGLVAALLPASLKPFYTRKLQDPGFDLFRHSSEIPAFRRQIRYLKVLWTKKL